MPENLANLAAESAAAAWLTKVVVDLVRRQAPMLSSNIVLLLGLVLGIVFNVVWALYAEVSFLTVSDFARTVIQGILAWLGAVVSTELQKATTARVRSAKIRARQ